MRKLGLLILILIARSPGLTDAQHVLFISQRLYSDAGSEFLKRGQDLAEIDNNYESALLCYNKAAEIFYKQKLWDKYAETYNCIGRAYNDLAKYQEAEKYIRKALEIALKYLGEENSVTASSYGSLASTKSLSDGYDSALYYNKKALDIYVKNLGADAPEVGHIYYQIGFVYGKQGDYDKQIEYCQKSIDIRKKRVGENDKYVAAAYNNIGYAYGRKGYYGKQLEYCTKGLQIRRLLFGDEHREVAISYNNIAYVYGVRGDYDKQLEYYEKALFIRRRVFGDNHPETATIYNNIGFSYMEKGDFSKQIEYSGKALEIFIKIFGENYSGLSYPYMNLGNAYLKLDEREKALEYYQKAYKLRGKSLGENHPDMVPAYMVLADYHRAKGDSEKELYYLNKSIDILKKNGYDRHPLTAELFNLRGEYFLNLRDYKHALDQFQRGLIAVSTNFESFRMKDNPAPETSKSKYLLLSLLSNKAFTVNRIAETEEISQETSYREIVLNTYEVAMRLIDNMRFGLSTEEFKKKITAKYASVYEGAVETAYRLYEINSDKKYLGVAFKASERNKAFLLQEALSDTKAKKFGGIPAALLEREKDIKVAISYYEDLIQKEQARNDNRFVDEFKSEVFSLRRELEMLTQKFEKEYPQYYALKYNTEPIDLENLQESLAANTTIAEYLVGERNMYVFLVDQGNVRLVKTDKPVELAERVRDLQKRVTERDFAGYSREAYRMYRDVFEPIRPFVSDNRLVLIPDGPLWYLNFDLLLSRPSGAKDYSKLAYLIKDYTFSYEYSATLRYGDPESGNTNYTSSNDRCLAFSFTGMPRSEEEHIDLPGSRAELQAISKTWQGQFLNGEEAGESVFKRLAPNYTVLHLALHGETDDAHPMNSALYFTSGDSGRNTSGKKDDGVLYAGELYNMSLKAELTVLSACNTGRGELIKGEGIISLGRAFSYAGCKSLVMSLWEVSDATAPDLMKYFYENLKRGMPKDEALRKAKLAYLASADNLSANPFYWGSFVMLGDNAPIHKKVPLQYAEIRSVLAALLLLSMLGVAKKVSFWKRKAAV